MMPHLPPLIHGHRVDLAQIMARMPATQLCGITVTGFGQGVSVLSMPIRPEITFDGKTVQGGLVGVLGDYAAVSAVLAAKPEGWFGSTVDFRCDNLDPADGDMLLAIGSARRVGQRSGTGTAEIFSISGDVARLVALVTANCQFIAPRSTA